MRGAVLSALLLGGDAAYSEDRAIEFAKLAGTAYCSKKSLLTWDCGSNCAANVTSVNICQGDSTKAWVGIWEGKPMVSFEGTGNVAGIVKDLEAWHTSIGWSQCDNCKVHNGFLSEYNSLRVCVQETLANLGFGPGSSIRTTGHSLGASVSILAIMDLTKEGWDIEESYDFGRPRTGDEQFAAIFSDRFKGRVWRMTHSRDPIPHLPPADLIVDWHFEHVYPEVYYRSSVDKGYVICDTADSNSNCAEQMKVWNLVDHSDYMGVLTSHLGCKIFDNIVV